MSWNIYLGTEADIQSNLSTCILNNRFPQLNEPIIISMSGVEYNLLLTGAGTGFIMTVSEDFPTQFPTLYMSLEINKPRKITFVNVTGPDASIFNDGIYVDTVNDKTYYMIFFISRVQGVIIRIFGYTTQIVKTSTGEVLFDVQGKYHCLEILPGFTDEGKVFDYWTGRKRKVNKRRWKFDIEFYPFITRGDYTGPLGFKKYYDLMDILYSNDFYIIAVDSEFERLNNKIYFPIKVLCPSVSELSSSKENNNVRLNITLEEENKI